MFSCSVAMMGQDLDIEWTSVCFASITQEQDPQNLDVADLSALRDLNVDQSDWFPKPTSLSLVM
jgi:hypothetical protein